MNKKVGEIMESKTYYSSPIGILEIKGTESGITSIIFTNDGEEAENIPEILDRACNQLDEYFKGERQSFDLKLSLNGTEFQRKVWDELIKIPYGERVTYRDIAEKLGNPDAVRAVGNANGKNPISIIVPCHRVIGSNGKLTGYAGGIDRKDWLLKHEMNKK